MQSLLTEGITTKEQARKLFLSARSSFSYEYIEMASSALCDNLFAHIRSLDVQTVLLFFPFRQEPNILPLMQKLLNIGVNTAFPLSHKSDIRLEFRYVRSTDDFIDGAYGIKEPNSLCKTVTDFSKCICIVPALAFDKKGMRIGYGKGYYDRFLEKFHGISIGVVFSDFVVTELPVEETDIPVDLIVTERGVIIPNENEYTPQKQLKKG